AGHLGEVLDAFWPVELGHLQLGEVLPDLGHADRFASHYDVGAGAFPEPGVGHGDGSGVGDPRVTQQQQFNLFGVDLLAAPVDDVLDPALDADVPLAADLADRGQVTGAVEAVGCERTKDVRGRVE